MNMQFLPEMKKSLTYLNNITNMKKTTFLLLLISFIGFTQTKTTGVVNVGTNLTVKLDLNSSNSTAKLTITSPSTSWYGLGFGTSFAPEGNGMPAGTDCVVLRSATNFSDSRINGSFNPGVDATQNWIVESNLVLGNIRTVIANRPFSTGDTNDYVFNYSLNSIAFLYASPGSGNFSVSYHGGSRGYQNATLTTLGIEDFSLNASTVFPNPTNGNFTVKTKTGLDKIEVYTQTGAFVKTIDVRSTTETEVNVEGLSTGIYLIQLQNLTEKTWKKVLVN